MSARRVSLARQPLLLGTPIVGGVIALALLYGCRSDAAADSPKPAPDTVENTVDDTERQPVRPETRTHRRPVRRPVVPADQGVVVRLEMEGTRCVCRINRERIGIYPDNRVAVVKVLERLNPAPRTKVALLDIHPRVPHPLVNLLVADCQLAGFEKLSFAEPEASSEREP